MSAQTSALRAKMTEISQSNSVSAGPWTTTEAAVELLLGGLGAGSTSSGTTLVPNLMGASATVTVPAGARGYLITIMTGTATVAGVAAIPAGITFSSSRVVAVAIAVTTAAASSAVVAWET